MRFREIRLRLGRLWQLYSRRTIKTVIGFAGQKQTIEPGNRAGACGWEWSTNLERQFGMHPEMKGQAAAVAASACTQRIAGMAVQAGIPVKKQFRADDIAREVLGTGSAAAISNVLVIGSEGFPSFKRMQIRLEDPRQVPGLFTLLATALRSDGIDFSTARNSSIPAAEIWLASPLNDWSRTLLSCAAPIGEQPDAGVLSRPASREIRQRIERRFPDGTAVKTQVREKHGEDSRIR